MSSNDKEEIESTKLNINDEYNDKTQKEDILMEVDMEMMEIDEDEEQTDEDEDCKQLITKSQYSQISDSEDEDDNNQVFDHQEHQISANEFIVNWINKHPDYYFPPSTLTDIEIIQRFVNEQNIQNTRLNVISNIEDIDLNTNDNTTDSATDTTETEIFSLNDDTEISTLIQSCQRLRDNISSI